MEQIFRGGVLGTPEGLYRAELGVSGGKIVAIGESLPSDGAEVVELGGKLLLPGAIDGHTHLATASCSTVSSDDYYTGTRAAACGGTTTVFDYILQNKGEPLPDSFRRRNALAAPDAAVDYAFHIGVSDLSTPELLASMKDVLSDGVSTFKAYMVYSFGLDDGALYRALRFSAQIGAMIQVHAENRYVIDERVAQYLAQGKTSPWWHYQSRDELVEGEADQRAIALARMAEAPLYLVHLADEEGMAAVRRARGEGYPVFAETCPQYLHFTSEVYRQGSRPQDFICSPPIKNQRSQEAIWAGIQSGDISTLATDHCPFTRAEKDWCLTQADGTPGSFATTPNGCDGIETMYPYLLAQANAGRISFAKALGLCCQNPAKLFGVDDRKGALRVGL
ncbi:MAG: dihydropyrimidinase, partial [Clostridia bacterium]|nr:dihydropyrimidinase [Clostridia bacterium]